jgi:predicted dehydrogenase
MRAPPLRVGLVGCGNVALNDHVPGYLARPDLYRVVAVADPTEDRRTTVAGALGLPQLDAHADVATLLARPDLDLVDVATPQHVRRPVIAAALASGRHVLSEKPLATVPADAAALVDAARAHAVVLAVMHNYLFMPEVAAVRRLVAEGAIGDVEVVIVNYLGVLDLPGNASYAPRWRHDLEISGGGVLVDMLHAVYVAESLLGRPVERVSGWAHARQPGAAVEDIALCRLEADGCAALVNVGWGHGPGGIEVSGSRGRIAVRYRDGGTGPFVPLEGVTLTGADGVTRPVPISPADDLYAVAAVLADLAEAIAEGREPIASGAHGLRALEATLAAYAAAHTGRTIRLPLAPEDPLHRRGALGLAELDAPTWSPVAARGLFGLVRDGAEP